MLCPMASGCGLPHIYIYIYIYIGRLEGIPSVSVANMRIQPCHNHVYALISMPCTVMQCEAREIDDFFHNMRSAALLDMPKLLACYEYYIALDYVDNSDPLLFNRCEGEQELIHSLARSLKGVGIAFKSLQHETSSKKRCTCYCGHSRKGWFGRKTVNCLCESTFMAKSESRKLVPSPSEFLKMTHANEAPKLDGNKPADVAKVAHQPTRLRCFNL